MEQTSPTQPRPEPARRHVLVQATVPPLDEDGKLAAVVGTVGFAIASVVVALRTPTRGGDNWQLWTCLVGLGIGLFFLAYCELRLWLRRQQQAEQEQAPGA